MRVEGMEALILKEKDMDTSARKNVWVRKRDGRNAEFDASRIVGAMEKAFRAELNLADAQPLDSAIIDDIEQITARLLQLAQDPQRQDALHVEQIQDAVASLDVAIPPKHCEQLDEICPPPWRQPDPIRG